MHILSAKVSRNWLVFVLAIVIAAIVAWMARHVLNLVSPNQLSTVSLNLIWFISFLAIAWNNVLAMLERPKTATALQRKRLDTLKVAILIPAYNEDAALLKGCIKSMLYQTRKPDAIIVVDDGSTVSYASVKKWLAALPDTSIELRWVRTENHGKRHAQVIGITRSKDADIYITVDSDTVLDPKAIEEGLLPFADKSIQSVAGLCLPINNHENLLTRFTGLWETVWQIVERSSQSTMNCVTVNTGQLAFYRGKTIRKYLKGYLSEDFFGRAVHFSDDSLMTMYAMQHGKTIQQPTSIAFSAVPNKVNHHIRRYMRWMRGSFIRTFWRFKYLPVTSYIYWLHMFRWVQFALSSLAIIILMAAGLATNPAILPYLVIVPILISYGQSLRYLTIKRNDESAWNRFATFLTAPLAMVWSLTVLRVVRWYSYATCYKTGWGTRSKVEVSI